MFIYAPPDASRVEREVWIRAGMFATIIALVALILVTPELLGRPSELASLPILIVAMTKDKSTFIVDVTAAVQPYLYEEVNLSIHFPDPNGTWLPGPYQAKNESFQASVYLPVDAAPFLVRAWLVDQQGNYFEANVTVRTQTDSEGRLQMVFAFPDDPHAAEVTRTPPEDFRYAVPRRGMFP